MDIAVLSDIHGNFEALKTCVACAQERAIGTFLFLGDYLGEFSFPQRTMEFLYRLKDTCRCVFIRGNKEDYWLQYRKAGEQGWKENNSTTGSLLYTYQNLTARDLDFFSEMEIARVLTFDRAEPITVCHGSPRQNREKLLPGADNTCDILKRLDTRLLLCGHTHIRQKSECSGKILLNPGSVGAPLQSHGKAQFLILHENGGKWTEEFLSLDYPVETEIQKLYASGLDRFAPYWCKSTIHLARTGKDSQGELLEKAMELCRKELGECRWPDIPERYWAQAYALFYGNEEETKGQNYG